MKIRNEGKWNNPWTLDVVCGNESCRAELTVEEDDVSASGYRYDTAQDYTAKCPVCRAAITLAESEISPRVRLLAEDRRPKRPCGGWD